MDFGFLAFNAERLSAVLLLQVSNYVLDELAQVIVVCVGAGIQGKLVVREVVRELEMVGDHSSICLFCRGSKTQRTKDTTAMKASLYRRFDQQVCMNGSWTILHVLENV